MAFYIKTDICLFNHAIRPLIKLQHNHADLHYNSDLFSLISVDGAAGWVETFLIKINGIYRACKVSLDLMGYF